MSFHFSFLMFGFWGLAYMAICYLYIKDRAHPGILMPLFAGSFNFAWELNAIAVSPGFYALILWAALDIIILIYNIAWIEKISLKIIYIVLTVVVTVVLFHVFRLWNGLVFSAFIIDVLISTEYLLVFRQISPHGKLPIASLRLLGDFFAWCRYNYLPVVFWLGIVVLLMDAVYLILSVKERNTVIRNK